MKKSLFKLPNIFQQLNNTSKNLSLFLIEYERTIEELAINLNWFIDPHIKLPKLKRLVQLKYSDNQKDIDSIMIEYLGSSLDEIQLRIQNNFPKRNKLIDEIFIAHKSELYSLSIISCFAQIDGIIFDKCNENNYFNHLEKLKKYLYESTLQTTENTLLKKSYELLLNDKLPIKMSQGKRGKDFNQLNRHQIIHGEVINYNNELNSLKAISLLTFISYLFSKIEEF